MIHKFIMIFFNFKETKKTNNEICEFNVVAKMSELTWDMFDTDLRFGNMVVKDLKINYNLRGIRTELSATLRKILINYSDVDSSINDAYEQIIQCVADRNMKQFFDFNLVLYNLSKVENEALKQTMHDEVNLYVGKIKVICLVKFVNELVSFMEPIINPLPDLTEQVRDQAYEAMMSAYQEQEAMNKKIFFNIHVASPQVIIPQNSASLSGFLVDLGNLHITNSFKEVPVEESTSLNSGQFSLIDEMSLSLENVEIKRILYEKNGHDFYKIKEQVVYPISLISNIKRPIKNLELNRFADLEIFAQINDLECTVSLKSAKLLFSILNENLNEGIQQRNLNSSTNSSAKESANFEQNNQTDAKTSEAVIEPVSPNQVSLSEGKEKANRVNLKINLELNKIKLVIVEIKRRSGTLSKDDSSIMTNLRDNHAVSGKGSVKTSPSFDQSVTALAPVISNLLGGKFSNFGLLEIQDILFDFASNENNSWLANLKFRALNVNDLRPDSNLAVKE